jgi:hypothetical protein
MSMTSWHRKLKHFLRTFKKHFIDGFYPVPSFKEIWEMGVSQFLSTLRKLIVDFDIDSLMGCSFAT